MSGARLEGSMPDPPRILGVLDDSAKDALTAAKDIVVPLAKAEAPGRLGDVIAGSVRKTETGYRATVQAAKRRQPYREGKDATVAQVVRWVNRGTGIHRQGPGPKHPITGKRGVLRPMVLPGGRRVRSVKGQKPNPFIARAETRAMVPVERALRAGAELAARALRRL
jgi:hypothetical protein